MNGYTVFLGPFAGIMISDYYLVHNCRVDVPAMYDPNGRYRYTSGIVSLSLCIYHAVSTFAHAHHYRFRLSAQNWRAALALIIAVPPLLPGLINSINPKIYIGGASHIFDIAWLYGFFVASGVYTAASLMFPAEETFLTDEEVEGSIDKQVGEVDVEGEKRSGSEA